MPGLQRALWVVTALLLAAAFAFIGYQLIHAGAGCTVRDGVSYCEDPDD